MSGGRSRVRGAAQLRRTLRRLPDATRSNLAEALRDIGQRLLLRARAETPVRTGRLRAALSFRVAAKTLKLRVGLLTKALQGQFFYGYILDAGRAAKTVTIRSGPRKGSRMRISPIARNRYDFVFGRRRDFEQSELPVMRRALSDALDEASRG